MTLESDFFNITYEAQTNREWEAFKELPVSQQEQIFRGLRSNLLQLIRDVEEATLLALESHKAAQIATAEKLGMPAELIDNYLR